MAKLAESIIGEYFDKGFVEALINRPNGGPSLRVCIRVQGKGDLSEALRHSDALLLDLIADMGRAERLATDAVRSSVPAVTFDIWIDRDGEASYTCGFFDGVAEDKLIDVQRSKDGGMALI